VPNNGENMMPTIKLIPNEVYKISVRYFCNFKWQRVEWARGKEECGIGILLPKEKVFFIAK